VHRAADITRFRDGPLLGILVGMSRLLLAFGCTAACVGGWLAGCSSFDDAPPAGGDGGGGADGSPSDAPATDDGPSGIDAGLDAKPSWIPCSDRDGSAAHFCDDFDRMGLPEGKWTNLLLTEGGESSYFDGGVSPPKSFRSFIEAGTTGMVGSRRAQLAKDTAFAKNRYRAAFAVRFDQLPYSANAGVGYSHFFVAQWPDSPCPTSTSGNQRAVELSFFSPNKVTVGEKQLEACSDGGADPSVSSLLAITPAELADGRFHDVVVELSHDQCKDTTKPFALRVGIDGVEYLCHPFAFDVFNETTVKTHVGAFAGGGSWLEASYVYDNVTIDLE
jgi:hypothetical protein